MKPLPKSLPKFLWHFSKRHIIYLLILITISIYAAVSISLNPYVLKVLVDRMAAADLNIEQGFSTLGIPAILYVFLTLTTSVVLRFNDWAMMRLFPQMKSEIISEIFAYLGKHSYSFFQDNFAGNLANKINDIARGAVNIICLSLDQFFSRILAFVVGAFTMFLVAPWFGVVLITWSVIFVTASIIFSKQTQKYSEHFSRSRSHIVGKIVDSISNILSIKLFAREEHEKCYLNKSLVGFVDSDSRLQWQELKVKAFYALSFTILIGTMIALVLYEKSKNVITVGDAVLVLTLTNVLIRHMLVAANQSVTYSEEIGACKQALSIISSKHRDFASPNDSTLHISNGTIVFKNVHFEYCKGQNLFVNKSVTLSGGNKVGLIGPSGSGKTTFVNLILRAFDVDSGHILIDGQNIKNVTHESLRSQIAMIPQDTYLFHRSLMENIRYGRLDATDEEVIESAKKARCHEFIIHLKEGYETLVGERGVKLSGGQRQRIAIARAILKNAPIFILDEATSSLDSSTENEIQKELSLLMKDKTTIVISHRLSTLSHMDRILVFSDGKIVEDGTSAQLIQTDGHFKKLWDMQYDGLLKDFQEEEGNAQTIPKGHSLFAINRAKG